MANIDVVKWDAPMGIFAWKFPSEELSAKTQLIVSESQEAILIKDGQMVGPFEPGKHTLNSNNYPFLTSLLKKEVTGRTPFTAEVWFIQKTFKLNIKWGTRTPIQLEDPQYHVMLPIRAYGQYGIQIENSAKFLIKIVGTLRYFNESDLISYLRGIILTCAKDQISKYIIEKNISILKISILLKELSENIEKMIIQECATFGILINNFNIESITTDDNDPAVQKLRNALAEKAEMDIMGYSYQQKRTFDTMQTAAGNESNNSIM
ncbi:MAG: SPFH domain-containing protein, partial [Lentisphaeria bacterium]|nr:SPFH domain-containing protein [Lentisphaeria bacterium]